MKITDIITEAANPAQQAAIAISMKKAGKKPKQGVAEGSDDELNARPGMWRGDAKRMTAKGKPTKDELGMQDNLKNRIKASNKKGGLTGPKCVLPEQGVAEGSLNELSKDTLKSYAKKAVPDMQASQKKSEIEAGKAASTKDDKTAKTHYDAAKQAKDRTEKRMAGISGAIKRVTKQGVAEDKELAEEFDLIESIVEQIAEHNGVDAEVVWEDLESLTEDELYVFAVTSDPLMEDWQKANKRDKTDGMSQKAVNAYRRENPGSKLKTAVTTKPSKLKKGGKASKRRKSYCSRSRGQMKMHSISCAKTPDKAICKARRRWNC